MTRKLFLVALSAALLAPMAQAQDSMASINSSVRIFAGAHHLDYVEHDEDNRTPDGIFDSEKGAQPLAGASIGWQFVAGPLKNVVVQVDVRQASGKTKYQGYLQTSHSPDLIPYRFDDVKAVTTETTVKLGYALVFNDGHEQVAPYMAHGTYRWLRDSSASPYGYREDYRHNVVALGAKYQSHFARTLTFEVDGSVGRTYKAGLDVPGMDLNFDLGPTTTSTVQLGLVHRLATRIDMRYGFEATRFGYGKSESKGGFHEPRSTSVVMNATAGLGYRF